MIKSLTSLRGIFILFIFFHHCLDLYPGGGTLGVAFFFVLGGFGLTLGYKNRIMTGVFDYKHFLAKRLIKFYPLHLLCLIASIPFALLSFSHLFFPSLFLNAALLQTWVPMRQVYFSFNAVSWYLADTMFFAVVFPFLLKWIVCASRKGKVLIAMVFAAIYTLVAAFIPNDMHHAILYISPYMRLTDFVLGIYLALAYLRLQEIHIGFFLNNSMREVFVFVLITLLVVESCVLPEDIRMFAPVYWPIVTLVIVAASLPSGSRGGGGLCWKTSGSDLS